MKKRINKKGFTLIELLAVIVIMLAISVMAISSISAAIERNKAKQDDAKIEVIENYAKLYYEAHKNSLPVTGCIPLSLLDLTDKEIEMSNGGIFPGGVTYTNGKDFTYRKDISC